MIDRLSSIRKLQMVLFFGKRRETAPVGDGKFKAIVPGRIFPVEAFTAVAAILPHNRIAGYGLISKSVGASLQGRSCR